MATARNLYPENTPTTRTPQMCATGWSANPGDPVDWQNPPANTTVTAVDSNPAHWPFNLTSGFAYPNTSTVMIRTNAAAGTYSYVVSTCTDLTTKTVTVG